MTATKPEVRRRLTALVRRRIDIAAAAVLLACGVTLFAVGGPSIADPDALAGEPVPAATGFQPRATDTGGSVGVGGLDTSSWLQWRPRVNAARADRRANLPPLGRQTCNAVGELRAAGVQGDLWKAAVAAGKAGLPTAIKARGIPSGAKRYVDKVVAYALWYAKQDVFRPDSRRAQAVTVRAEPVKVRDEYVASVRAAGRLCPTITPARVAAQLMAVSRFDPNLRSANGAAGIAQYSPELWQRYRLSRTATVWEPKDAIPALGAAMCDLVGQLSGLSGGDPYVLALGVYQWGMPVIRGANGLPRVNIPQLGLIAPTLVGRYEQDRRLRPAPSVNPAAATSVSAPAPLSVPSASGPASGPAAAAAASAAPKPGAKAKADAESEVTLRYEPGATYRIRNVWAGPVLELRLTPAKSVKYVVITNTFSGKSLGIRNATKGDHGELVQLSSKPSDPHQQWELRDAGDGQVHIINRNSGKALEIIGDDIGPNKDGTFNGVRINRFPCSGTRSTTARC
ncbi:RICIN domain-containing protein [Jidongwangia harbinensis]|uniref:RICIN domain-containing protein n=1 Tax=Jidongwangia harbinensis TaxID=2878561 RepID=UPI001CD9CFC9|nr:RICIN domain-containing protein [Jidongwangia harbinensis]MCA2217480.1 RICIN domain-containing protein [Jidongwangia harbinensis]